MGRNTPDDDAEMWCPHCGQTHTGSTVDAIQDRIQNICDPEGEL